MNKKMKLDSPCEHNLNTTAVSRVNVMHKLHQKKFSVYFLSVHICCFFYLTCGCHFKRFPNWSRVSLWSAVFFFFLNCRWKNCPWKYKNVTRQNFLLTFSFFTASWDKILSSSFISKGELPDSCSYFCWLTQENWSSLTDCRCGILPWLMACLSFSFCFFQVIGLFDVFTPATTLEEFNDV